MEILKIYDYDSTIISEFEMYKRVLSDQELFASQYISVLRPKLIDKFAEFIERSYQITSTFYGDYSGLDEKGKYFPWTYKKTITIDLFSFLEQRINIGFKESDGIDAILTVDDWMRRYFNVNMNYKFNEYMMLINMLSFEAAEKVSSIIADDNFYICKCSTPKLANGVFHVNLMTTVGKYVSDIKMHYPFIEIIPKTHIRDFFDELCCKTKTNSPKQKMYALLFGEYRNQLQSMMSDTLKIIYVPVNSCKKLAELYQLNYSIRNIFEMNNINFDYKKFLK